MLCRQKDKDDGSKSDSNANRIIRGFRVAHVFDVAQTDGKPLSEFAEISGDPGENLQKVRELIEADGITLSYEQITGGALGRSAGGEITVLPGLSTAEEFAVLVHEFAHELLHRNERRKQTDKTIRETEAEAVSFAVGNAIGLDPSKRSSDYIQLYQGITETLTESLGLIQKTASKILGSLEREIVHTSLQLTA